MYKFDNMSINLEELRDMTQTLTSFECRNDDTTGGGALHGIGKTSISRGAQVAKISKVWRCSPSSLSTAKLTVSRINTNEVLVHLSFFFRLWLARRVRWCKPRVNG
jgi:hypothetical protein